jgi:hypothetical protein
MKLRDRLNPLRRRRHSREAARGIRSDIMLPYDMFDEVRNARDSKTAGKLAGIYHKGQAKAWDGREVLDALIEKHGPIAIPAKKVAAIQRVFAVILWGELAAWKISTDLALRIEPLEAKMAATSQAHDEARHFYVMHDYLELLGPVPTKLVPGAERVLAGTLSANNLAKKLIGMQLMIEPMALTLFQVVRESGLEPLLAELLTYYERDEARHVALGVLHLPKLLKNLSVAEAADLWAWQFREFWCQFNMLRELEEDFHTLGINPVDVVALGRGKQIRANEMMIQELGYAPPVQDLFLRFFDMKAEWDFPSSGQRSGTRDRMRNALQAAFRGNEANVDLYVDPLSGNA